MDFGFVGDAYSANSPYQDCQELVNFFIEDDPRKEGKTPLGPADRGDLTLYPTPGLTTKAQLSYAEVRGLRTLSGGQKLVAVSGATVYLVDANFNQTVIGSLNTFSGQVKITDNGIQVYMTDGNNRYAYDLTTSTFSIIAPTDGAFTGGEICDVVDNFIVYNRPGTQQWAACLLYTSDAADE